MKRWWTVIRIAQHRKQPLTIVKKGKMSKQGIIKAVKRACVRDGKTSNYLASGYRYVFQEKKPEY